MPTVMIMTKKFAEVSRDPLTTLEQAGFTVVEKDYDRVQPSQEDEVCRAIQTGWTGDTPEAAQP